MPLKMALKIELESSRVVRCGTEIFKINGIKATVDDFGEVDISNAGKWHCSVHFLPKRLRISEIQKLLDKYNITEDDIDEILDKLDFHFKGYCNGCQ